MINVHITPDYLDKPDKGDGGIRRVVEAQIKYLPQFGIQHVRNPQEAHIIITHGASGGCKGAIHIPGVPQINVNHGLYWSRQPWEAGYQQVNGEVVESMCRAVAHTVPSEWVGVAVRRGGLFYPEVIYHGIDAQEFTPLPQHERFVLWNKARADYVSNPDDLMKLANLMPNTEFHTTIGNVTPNVKVLGTTNYLGMKNIVSLAGVYLATTRETFGIGTLEAMALGVPVAGWNWGGQAEIIKQGETGYLAPPGDFQVLVECVEKCIAEWDRLSANCIEDARTRWKWESRIRQYADIIKRVYQDYYELHRPKVSIIVTACNLDRYLPSCLESVECQNFRDFECLVIDDAQQESTRKIVESFARADDRIRYLPTPNNFGLVGARNFGFSQARGRYIRHLDADDFLADNAIALEANCLNSDPSVHIVYGHLESVNEDGSRILQNEEPVRSNWPPNEFHWVEQMAHLNQIPSCVMMRREVLERSGGYRERMKRNEDAEFWCRVTSLGFRAWKFTQAVTYYHRQRGDSKGALEWATEGREPDWTAWFRWRVGAKDYREAVDILRKYSGNHPRPQLVPFAAQAAPTGRNFWYVHDYAYPVVSIIVTCGPNHRSYLTDALDSIQAQTFPDWECIVVNDTGTDWDENIMGSPWAKVINLGENKGVATARNEGLKYAKGKLIIWMDADDYWMPWLLESMVANAEKNPNSVIYSDIVLDDGEKKSNYRYQDFNSERIPHSMCYPGSSVLYPRKATQDMMAFQGGFDKEIPGMEDWDYQIGVHVLGYCGLHIPEPLFAYRRYSSTKRESDYAKIESIKEYLDRKWFKYRKGGEKLMCSCNQQKKVTTKPNSELSSSGNFTVSGNAPENPIQMIQVEYIGPTQEDFSIRSRVDRSIFYRFGNNQYHKERTVFAEDAEFLISQTDGNGNPIYRILGNAQQGEHDPAQFLGQPVAA